MLGLDTTNHECLLAQMMQTIPSFSYVPSLLLLLALPELLAFGSPWKLPCLLESCTSQLAASYNIAKGVELSVVLSQNSINLRLGLRMDSILMTTPAVYWTCIEQISAWFATKEFKSTAVTYLATSHGKQSLTPHFVQDLLILSLHYQHRHQQRDWIPHSECLKIGDKQACLSHTTYSPKAAIDSANSSGTLSKCQGNHSQ